MENEIKNEVQNEEVTEIDRLRDALKRSNNRVELRNQQIKELQTENDRLRELVKAYSNYQTSTQAKLYAIQRILLGSKDYDIKSTEG